MVPILIALQNLQGNISQTFLNYELYRDLLKMQILVHCVAVTVEWIANKLQSGAFAVVPKFAFRRKSFKQYVDADLVAELPVVTVI